MKHLAAIGFGYTAAALARQLAPGEWRVTGTKRTEQSAAALRRDGIDAFVLDDTTATAAIAANLADVTHILLSAAPGADGDPVIERLGHVRGDLARLEWIGYLSTVGVYGNHDGA